MVVPTDQTDWVAEWLSEVVPVVRYRAGTRQVGHAAFVAAVLDLLCSMGVDRVANCQVKNMSEHDPAGP